LIADSRTASLFRRLLGAAFDSLPHPVQLLHEGRAELIASGRCDVERGSSLLSRLLAALTALPAEGRDVPVTVVIRADAERETWTRAFRGQRMCSTLEEVRALGVPLPAAWFRGVTSRESADGPRYHFDVRAQLPIAGLLVHYRGTLDVD
jgi:hypothetical protein